MSKRPQKKLPTHHVELAIKSLSHDGRGVAHLDGKAQFVAGALAGETVRASYVATRSRFDELKTQKVIVASSDRVDPVCEHAKLCGGCSLQHLDPAAQIELKQSVLEEQLLHFGKVDVASFVEPMIGPELGYRRKARLAVKYAGKRGQLSVGFREKSSSHIINVQHCPVLDERIGEKITALRDLIKSLKASRFISHVEVAVGDSDAALVFRHTELLKEQDTAQLIGFGELHSFEIYLQPQGADSAYRILPEKGEERLSYRLDEFDLCMKFHPLDFTQVNADINRKMVSRAVEWLDIKTDDKVLDLFCGLGNFTLPLARKAGSVVGIEGDESLVVRGRENASYNNLDNVSFYGADLNGDFTQNGWAKEGFDKILIDPPRSGALDIVNYLSAFGASRIVYVSCNPSTLARDAGVLVGNGYRMTRAGVMDMFPHTTHVESIALFEK